MPSLLTLNECPHIMADAYLCDERRTLIFISVWGRDTAIQELLARLTLSDERCLTQLTLRDEALNEHILFPGSTDNLEKRSSRHTGTRFGTLVNLWLFDRRCTMPDKANGQSVLLLFDNDPHWQLRVWALLQATTTLPLQAHWQSSVIEMLQNSNMLTPVPGRYGAVSGWQLNLDLPHLTALISHAIRQGELYA